MNLWLCLMFFVIGMCVILSLKRRRHQPHDQLSSLHQVSEILYKQMAYGDRTTNALSSTDDSFESSFNKLASTLDPQFYIDNGVDKITTLQELKTVLAQENQVSSFQKRFISNIVVKDHRDDHNGTEITLNCLETFFLQNRTTGRFSIMLEDLTITYVKRPGSSKWLTTKVLAQPIKTINIPT